MKINADIKSTIKTKHSKIAIKATEQCKADEN